MFGRQHRLMPREDRGPLRVAFIATTLPVGGAETLLVDLVRRIDRSRFTPEVVCLKYLDVLGEVLAREIPVHTELLTHKFDLRVLPRLTRLLRQRRVDAVITVGTGGDRMFWGRLAAWLAGVPVICSAIHSTGYPDRIEVSNKLLRPLTDAFIAVAPPHAEYLRSVGCPANRVRMIPNGVDTEKFAPRWPVARLYDELALPPGSPVAAIVAALRPEKNHELFLRAAALVKHKLPAARMLIVGDGARRPALESLAAELGVSDTVRFLGSRHDVADVLSLAQTVVLSSHMEANPISILEALASEKPVVATRVGSVPETVIDGRTGYLVEPGNAPQMAQRILQLLGNPEHAAALGRAGREEVLQHWSIAQTVGGYQELINEIYDAKAGRHVSGAGCRKSDPGQKVTGRA